MKSIFVWIIVLLVLEFLAIAALRWVTAPEQWYAGQSDYEERVEQAGRAR